MMQIFLLGGSDDSHLHFDFTGEDGNSYHGKLFFSVVSAERYVTDRDDPNFGKIINDDIVDFGTYMWTTPNANPLYDPEPKGTYERNCVR